MIQEGVGENGPCALPTYKCGTNPRARADMHRYIVLVGTHLKICILMALLAVRFFHTTSLMTGDTVISSNYPIIIQFIIDMLRFPHGLRDLFANQLPTFFLQILKQRFKVHARRLASTLIHIL